MNRWICSLLNHPGATLFYDEEGFLVKDCSCRTILFISFDPDHEWDLNDFDRILARYGLEDR